MAARRGFGWWVWVSLATLAADRATKAAVETSTAEGFRRAIVSRCVYLVHASNAGIAFSLFADSESKWVRVLLVTMSTVVIGAMVWLLASGRAGGGRAQIGFALILGGAAGNFVDRLWHGSVTDFLEVWLGSYRWPAFNLADSAITIGTALVAIELLLGRWHPGGEKA